MGEDHIPQRGVRQMRIRHDLDNIDDFVIFGAEEVGSENLIVIRLPLGMAAAGKVITRM